MGVSERELQFIRNTVPLNVNTHERCYLQTGQLSVSHRRLTGDSVVARNEW
jgi:hypothetical protein